MNAPHERQALRAPTLLSNFLAVRARSLALAAPLSAEDCCVQSMPDASPVKWHLAHTSWFFETFILERFEPGFSAHHPAFRMLFNSYYNGVGERHLRVHRGHLTRPSHAEVLAYRADIDARVTALLADEAAGENGDGRRGEAGAKGAAIKTGDAGDGRRHAARAELAELVALGLQHEQQHQELIMTDVLHLLSMNPLKPALLEPAASRLQAGSSTGTTSWCHFDVGIVQIGHDGEGFCFDNETPRHRQFVEPFALASRLVRNGEFLRFIEAGGYRDASLWLSEGWDWVCANGLRHPLYWQQDAASVWHEFTPHGLMPLEPDAPLVHVSLYEAEAYARWAQARLPTEAEWESAASSPGLEELYDCCWQWTTSSYAPYPGYAPAPGALGEYNGKFMINQYVLRGGACVTAPGHTRPSYRNFFPAPARWQFSGIRLAKSIGTAG